MSTSIHNLRWVRNVCPAVEGHNQNFGINPTLVDYCVLKTTGTKMRFQSTW